MASKIEEMAAVFWDGMHEGTFRLRDFEAWMRDAGATGTIVQWRHSLAKWFPEKIWKGDIYSDFERLWDGQFTTVTGMVKVQNIFITNADDFSALTSVGEELYIYNNDVLENVDGLSALTSVGGYLQIRSNSLLTNVDGFSALTSVGSGLYITSNASLENVYGLSALTSVGEGLYIYNNDVLENVDGLSALTSVGSGLYISHNIALSDDKIKALKDQIYGI